MSIEGAPFEFGFSFGASIPMRTESDAVLLDPSSIGLNVDEKEKASEVQTGPQAATGVSSYSSYLNKRGKEAVKRKNLNERLEKLRNSYGIAFNIPQCETITTNQLAMFIRRKLRKLNEIRPRPIVSTEVQRKILGEDVPTPTITRPTEDSASTRRSNELMAVIPVNQLFASDEESLHDKDDEDELTEQSTDSEDDQAFTPELQKYYSERAKLLASDAKASWYQRDILEQQQKVYLLEQEHQAEFAFPETEGRIELPALEDDAMDDEDEEYSTCARCRPLEGWTKRQLVEHEHQRRESQRPRPFSVTIACGTEEYSRTDEFVHPALSQPSAITMEAQVAKYLHLLGSLPNEVEARRYKTAELCYGKSDGTHKFYNFDEEGKSENESGDEDKEGFGTISLSLRRRYKRHKAGEDYYSETEDSETDELDFQSRGRIRNRRGTHASGSGKKINPHEVRRSLNANTADYGSSMFDYDSQFLDMGLPTFQNVENQEIAIPSFRKKSSMREDNPRENCHYCATTEDPDWTKTMQLHAELEAQEKLRNKPTSMNSRTRL